MKSLRAKLSEAGRSHGGVVTNGSLEPQLAIIRVELAKIKTYRFAANKYMSLWRKSQVELHDLKCTLDRK